MAFNVMAHNISRWVCRIGGLDIVGGDSSAGAGEQSLPADENGEGLGGEADSAGEGAAGPGESAATAATSGRRPPRRRQPGERKDFVATDTLRRHYLAIPGRLARSARRLTLHLPARWPWAEQFLDTLDAIRSVQMVV